MKKKLMNLAAIALAGSMLIGCGSSASTDTTASDTAVTSDTEAGSAAEETSAASDKYTTVSSSMDNEVSWLAADKVTGLDMYLASNNAHKVDTLWADFLFASDHEGTYSPYLATDWTWSDDYLTLDVTLRDDVYFTNGEKLTASDVAFTYQRILTDENLTNYRYRDNLTEAVAIDDTHVQFRFFKAMPSFISESTRTAIICQSAYEANPDTYFDKPIGSGAYTVESFDPSTGDLTFKRNDDWWGWGVLGEKSNVEIFHYSAVADSTTRVSSLRSGQYDAVEDVTLDMIDTLYEEGFNVETYYQQRHFFMAVNCKGVMADPDIREAFSLCIDRELIVETIVGDGHVCDWVRPAMYLDYYDDGEGYPYDPDKAAELLANSSYNGEEIELLLGDSVMARGSEVLQAIQAMAQAVGFNINCQILENTTVVQRRFSGDYDLAFAGMTGTNGENLNEVLELYGSTDKFNTGYVDETQFAMIEAAAQIVDDEERKEALIEAEKLVKDSNAYIFLYEPLIACGVNPRVSNLGLYSDAYMDFRFMQVMEE